MTVSTFYPDGDPETTSVDGSAGRGTVSETFGTIRAGAGQFSDDSAALISRVQLEATTTSPNYDNLIRDILLFDSASLPDTDTIDSATFEGTSYDLREFSFDDNLDTR